MSLMARGRSPLDCRASLAMTLIFIFALSFSLPAYARTTATYGQNSVGADCKNIEKATDFDAIAQCNSGTGAGTMQTAPLVVGTVTSPPYAAVTCDANKAGMIQWTGAEMQYCDGANWNNFGAGVCAGPATLSFTNQTDVAVDTAITSNAETMSGFTCAAQVVCAGCVIVKNGVAVGTSTTTVAGDTIAVRQTSAATYNTITTVLAYVGTTSASFSVTTAVAIDPCDDATPDTGQECLDGTVYAGLSPDGNVKMFTTRCDVGQVWDGLTCTLARVTKKWGTTGGQSVTSTITGEYNTTALAALGDNYEAAYNCHYLTQNGRDDWYLPASQEWQVLYVGNAAIGNFDTSGVAYWISVSTGESTASCGRFSDGVRTTCSKGTLLPVRCVRK